MGKISFNQPPKKAIASLEKKYPELHFDYDEIMYEAHHKAFTVAKVTKLDLLKDIQNSLIKARENGETFESWKKELTPTLKKKGWYGYTTVTNPVTGESKEIYVGSRRLRNIFFTNTRVAYNVGRWEHQKALDDAPYLRYVAILDSQTRREHKSNHGVIRHRDDAFWSKNYPPNGWNCRCRVQAYSMESIKSRGWEDKLKAKANDIASKDWAYDVRDGGTKELDKLLDKKIKALPEPLKANALSQEELDKLYTTMYKKVDIPLKTYLLGNRPKMQIEKSLLIDARYQLSTQIILIANKEIDIKTLRHEMGHHVDNMNEWFSDSLKKSLKSDQLNLLTNETKKEISKMLEKSNDLHLHDLFFINSGRKLGEPTRPEGQKLSVALIVKETFANIFEIILSGDKQRIATIKGYFPLTFAKIEAFLKGL